MKTFETWHVPKDFAEPMYNYLVYGYKPGSCFTSVLANDFAGAIVRSHPANSIESFKHLVGWMSDIMPNECRGSYEAVNNWCYHTAEQRRAVLENHNLIYSSQDEVMMILKNEPTWEPHLY